MEAMVGISEGVSSSAGSEGGEANEDDDEVEETFMLSDQLFTRKLVKVRCIFYCDDYAYFVRDLYMILNVSFLYQECHGKFTILNKPITYQRRPVLPSTGHCGW